MMDAKSQQDRRPRHVVSDRLLEWMTRTRPRTVRPALPDPGNGETKR